MALATREWVDFFVKAGIPSDEATSYAIIFSKNRIQKNMLVDLNKEYLKEMGITLLGDVIAILKHAKSVHECNSRAWVMSASEPIVVEDEPVNVKPPSPTITPVKASSTVKRLLDHYTKKYKEAEEILSTEVKMAPKKKESKMRLKKESAEDLPKVTFKSKSKANVERSISLPEHSTKVTITDGKNVFARLGEGSVSSTTDSPPPKKKVSTSIFARLGGVSSTSASPTTKKSSLPYAGVLKASGDDEPLTGTMRADVLDSGTNKRKNQADFLRARDLKMLKITTEFSDDDESPAVSRPVKVKPQEVKPSKKKRPLQADDDDDDADDFNLPLAPYSPPKRVRFGGTQTLVLREPSKPGKPSVFAGHTIVTKSSIVSMPVEKTFSKTKGSIPIKQEVGTSVHARIGVVRPRPVSASSMSVDSVRIKQENSRVRFSSDSIKIKQENVRARIGVVRPRPAQPISKMVSDNMKSSQPIKKVPVKNRIELPKSRLNLSKAKSIHDRLG